MGISEKIKKNIPKKDYTDVDTIKKEILREYAQLGAQVEELTRKSGKKIDQLVEDIIKLKNK